MLLTVCKLFGNVIEKSGNVIEKYGNVCYNLH